MASSFRSGDKFYIGGRQTAAVGEVWPQAILCSGKGINMGLAGSYPNLNRPLVSLPNKNPAS